MQLRLPRRISKLQEEPPALQGKCPAQQMIKLCTVCSLSFFESFLSSKIGIHRPKSNQDPKHKCPFSVADPGCLSRIPDPDFYPSRIPDLGFFTQKIVTKLSKIWVWDPGSEIRDPEKTHSVSRIQGSKRHRTPVPLGSGSATLCL